MKTSSLFATGLTVCLSLVGLHQDAHAESGDIALGAKISTLGVGPDLTIGLLDSLNIRAAGHWGSIEIDGEGEDINYDCDLDLRSGLVTVEWFPLGGSFHIVAGAFINGNSFDASGDLNIGADYKIGGYTYSYSEIGSLEGEIEYDSVGPYFGIGWGNPVSKDANFTYFIDLGIAYQGKPDVSLKATGTSANDPTFIARLQEEEDELQEDLDEWEYYPVISMGLTYKFF